VTDAARSGGTERRKRGLPGPYLGGAIALYHRMARKERRHRHSGSSVSISISSRKGRAKIPVGIGAAEGSESDHDEITQLAARLGITAERALQEYSRSRFRISAASPIGDLMALWRVLTSADSRRGTPPIPHRALRQKSGTTQSPDISACSLQQHNGASKAIRGSRGGCA